MRAYERFLKYVTIDTQSDANSNASPTTEKQKDLGRLLVQELHELGITNAFLDDFGYVYACVKGNCEAKPFALLAHMDTSPDLTGKDVKPQIIYNYDGKDIKLNDEYTLRIKEFPEMVKYTGKDLIVTDGTTLLGADNKAGVAEIMAMVEELVSHPEIEHGDVYVVFTPDEEVGKGTDNFNFEHCPCEFGYTCDGGAVGTIDFENFNAASTTVTFTGVSIHPGTSKNKMINAAEVALEYHRLLPEQAKPEYTDGYDGFYHLHDMVGCVEEAKLEYILRNHDRELFERQKEMMEICASFINQKYNRDIVKVQTVDSYYNMKEKFDGKMYIVEMVEEALRNLGYDPKRTAIRGGTDGANLTYMGMCCPNLGTGCGNCHGRYEYACIQEMDEAVKVLLEIVRLVKERG